MASQGRSRARIPRAFIRTCLAVAGVLVVSDGMGHAQAPPPPTDGASGVHALVGGFVGRFDLDDGGSTDLFGGRAGIGLGQIAHITGFYWRGFDRSADSITADQAWGGELQLNLNAGFGLTPYLTGGIGRVQQEGSEGQTTAIAGGGVMFPLGPVLVHAGARDYMFGVTGLGDDEADGVTHNWLYSAGVTFAIGARRRRAAIVAAPLPPDPATLRDADARLAALRDSLFLAGDGSRIAASDSALMLARLATFDSLVSHRSYHSAQSIQIPIPTEGSITLRYGPDRPAAAAPIVVTTPGAGRADVPATASAATILPQIPAGVTLDDPAAQAWLRQLVAAQVAEQVGSERAALPAQSAALTQAQLDAIVQRVINGVMASVVPQLDAAQARRMDVLRDELRVAIADARVTPLQPEGRAAQAAPIAAPPAAPIPAPGVTARDAVPDTRIDDEARAAETARVAEERERADAALALTRAEAAQRAALALTVDAHARFLSGAETDRGPAAVIGDAAFETGVALVSNTARQAVEAVADVLRAHPDHRIYIQGHTDGAGDELANQRLSELRAEAVRSLLVQSGIETDRLFAIGYGQARPVADNSSPAGRALNRRVEIVIGEPRSVAAR
jgi:outer membrane protein OmpA-like peptidoglycan-associated protein